MHCSLHWIIISIHCRPSSSIHLFCLFMFVVCFFHSVHCAFSLTYHVQCIPRSLYSLASSVKLCVYVNGDLFSLSFAQNTQQQCNQIRNCKNEYGVPKLFFQLISMTCSQMHIVHYDRCFNVEPLQSTLWFNWKQCTCFKATEQHTLFRKHIWTTNERIDWFDNKWSVLLKTDLHAI